MREVLHAELLVKGLDTVVSGEGHWPDDIRRAMRREYEAALGQHAPFALLSITMDAPLRHSVAGELSKDLLLASLTGALRVLPREGDIFAFKVDSSSMLVALARSRQEATDALARRLVAAAKRLPVPGVVHPVVASVSIGFAFARYDAGYWLETLLAVAQDGARVASSSGGGRAVHTELYSFHQKSLEKLHPDWPKPVVPPAPASRPQASPAVAPATPPPPAAAPLTAPARQNIQDLEERVLRLAREWAQDALDKALAEQNKLHSSKVDLLERRIAKLSKSLEEAQIDLERAQAGAETDPGIASTFRAVQGLRGGEDVAAKLEMLKKLVEMNLALREQFSSELAIPPTSGLKPSALPAPS
ncbi:MAG: hypothetical protein ACKVXR_03220 [Planctomycetota bacterium]